MSDEKQKACPVLLRRDDIGQLHILAFDHPSAGRQLVKGTIHSGERPDQAALRELAEESGIRDAVVGPPLGSFEVGPPRQVWHAYVCEANNLPHRWTFATQDDGGHEFRFFWHPIAAPVDAQWHLIFRQALLEIRTRLATLE